MCPSLHFSRALFPILIDRFFSIGLCGIDYSKNLTKSVIFFLVASVLFGMLAYKLADHYDRQGHEL